MSHAAGVPEDGPTAWDMLAEIIEGPGKTWTSLSGRSLMALPFGAWWSKATRPRQLCETAQEEKADLIMMPSHGYTFNQFLLGSVTAKVLHGTECPVWTGAHVEESPAQKFAIRNILCAVDFDSAVRKAVSWAAQMAAEFGARLTLAHVTAGVEFWGPGGSYVNPEWKEALVGDASQHIAELQQEMGIKADVFIGSGDVPKVLSQAAKQTKADLLVTGATPMAVTCGPTATQSFARCRFQF